MLIWVARGRPWENFLSAERCDGLARARGQIVQEIMQDLADPANGLAHLSYIFLITAMLMTSQRWLRVLALLSGLAAMAHFLFRTQDNASLVWEAMFVLANGLQLLILWLRSRRGHMAGEERELLESILQIDDPANQRRLLGLLQWRDIAAGDVLMQQGDRHPPLLYVATGAGSIEVDDRIVSVCGSGDFLGEMSHITGAPASASVRVSNAMRVAQFDRAQLAEVVHVIPEIGKAVDGALNRSLAAKLVRMNEAAKAVSEQSASREIGG